MKSIWEVDLIDKSGRCFTTEFGVASNAEEAGRLCRANNSDIRGLQVGLVIRVASVSFGLPKNKR